MNKLSGGDDRKPVSPALPPLPGGGYRLASSAFIGRSALAYTGAKLGTRARQSTVTCRRTRASIHVVEHRTGAGITGDYLWMRRLPAASLLFLHSMTPPAGVAAGQDCMRCKRGRRKSDNSELILWSRAILAITAL